MRMLRRLLIASGLATLAGCAIPPRPQAPMLATAAPLAGVPGKSTTAWPEPDWWTRYHDDQLDALESRALAGAPTLAVARARFDEAMRAIDVANAEGGLDINANAQVQRQRLSENGLIPPKFLGFTWYNQGDLNLSFKYDFDFWGRKGHAVAAATDRARAAAAEREAATAMLTSAVADTYFSWQATQARLALAVELTSLQEGMRAIAAARARQEIDSPDLVLQSDAQLAAAREQAAALGGTAEIQRAALAALLGVAPAEVELKAHVLPQASADLPENATLDLIARRADVAASRWRVEAALRDADVARDAFYPDISISALLGLQSIDLGKLFSAGSRVMSIGPALHLPIFDNGKLHARFGASQAALQAAIADYDAAVVDAAREVATQALTLRQVQSREHEHAAQIAAAENLRKSAQTRENRGVIDARPVLAARVEVQRQRDAEIQLDAAALSAEIALTKALGGGYRSDSQNNSNAVSGAASP
jgi:multidrug efflux system outer membrane protein